METKERDQLIFNLAESFLKEKLIQKHNNPDIIKNYLTPIELKSIPEFYKRLLESAANRNRSEGVIVKPIGEIDNLKELLFDFDVRKVIENYDEHIILNKIKNKFGDIYINEDNEKQGLWFIFCKTIISGAKFLDKFEDYDDFRKFVNFFHQDERARNALPLLLKQEVDGFGLALSCDFLKESGFYWYAKPDKWMIKIFSELNISQTVNDYEVLNTIVRVAKSCNKTPYLIDKIFWLLGSGKFYNDKNPKTQKKPLMIGRHAEDFIKFVKDKGI